MKNSISYHTCNTLTIAVLVFGLYVKWTIVGHTLQMSVSGPGNLDPSTLRQRLGLFHELAPDAYADPVSIALIALAELDAI